MITDSGGQRPEEKKKALLREDSLKKGRPR
jgi:hypothetical protein